MNANCRGCRSGWAQRCDEGAPRPCGHGHGDDRRRRAHSIGRPRAHPPSPSPTPQSNKTGWGLDFVWPFLLKYPTNRIAVLDEVCMVHPEKKKGSKSIYSSGAPYDQRVEEARREAQFGYTRAAVRRLGYPFYPVQELGAVDADAWQGSLERLDRAVRARLGPWFPVLLGLQALAGMVCLVVLGLRLARRRRKGKSN